MDASFKNQTGPINQGHDHLNLRYFFLVFFYILRNEKDTSKDMGGRGWWMDGWPPSSIELASKEQAKKMITTGEM